MPDRKLPLHQRPVAVYQGMRQQTSVHINYVWERSNQRTNNYLTYLAQAFQEFRRTRLKDAVRLAYWALFSLFPLLVLSILIATFIFGIRNVKAQVYIVLSQMIPDTVSVLVRDSIDQVVARRGTYSFISVTSLIFGATRLFTELQSSLSHIFRDKKPRPWILQVLLGILMILTLTCLLVGSVNISAWLKAINLQLVGRKSPLVGIGAAVGLILTNTAIFTLLFRFIPRRKIRWLALLPAALLGGIAYELSRGLFDWYLLHIANFGLVYGSVGAVIGLLTWMFLLGSVVLFCAEFAVATDDWLIAGRAELIKPNGNENPVENPDSGILVVESQTNVVPPIYSTENAASEIAPIDTDTLPIVVIADVPLEDLPE